MDALEAFEKMNQRPAGYVRSVDFTGTVSKASNDDDDDDDDGASFAKDNRKGRKDMVASEDIEQANRTSNDKNEKGCQKNVVTDLTEYQGDSLEEKVDTFTKSHTVVMFTKSWCLFSVEAQAFMMNTFNVSIHILELDTHRQGKIILKYLVKKTGHRTVPVIFIKGDFLGGFDDVNAMYASGQLEKDYLTGRSHADRCEDFLIKSHMSTKPLFCFPEKVNGHVVRISGIITCLVSAAAAGFIHAFPWGAYIAYALCCDFFLRLFAGARFSPIGKAATAMASCVEPQMRVGRPKQFAAMCGLTMSLAGSIIYSVPFPYHNAVGSALMGALTIAAGMEGFFDFCLGCFIFKYLVTFGLVPK